MITSYKRLAVLITCYNRKRTTIACLDSFYKAITNIYDFSFDIFLVDDGSTDGTSIEVKFFFPDVNIIHGNGSLFWNQGMRLAWETAAHNHDYNFYLWLNDDTLLFPHSIAQLLKESQFLLNNSIIVGSTVSKSTNEVTYGGRLAKKGIIKPNGSLQKCDLFNGNCVLIPNHVYNSLGNLTSYYRHSLGDFDYGLRAKKNHIDAFLSSDPIGTCEMHIGVEPWMDNKISLISRLKALYHPLGSNPFEFFYYDFHNNGLFNAVFHFFTIHLRVLMPGIKG